MDNLGAYREGKRAHAEGIGPLDNPHTPAPPGDPLLASLWRAGWQSAKRKGQTHEQQD